MAVWDMICGGPREADPPHPDDFSEAAEWRKEMEEYRAGLVEMGKQIEKKIDKEGFAAALLQAQLVRLAGLTWLTSERIGLEVGPALGVIRGDTDGSTLEVRSTQWRVWKLASDPAGLGEDPIYDARWEWMSSGALRGPVEASPLGAPLGNGISNE